VTQAVTTTTSAAPQSELQPVANSLGEGAATASAARPPREVDVLRAIAWSVRSPTPVNLGPCADLQATVQRALRADPRSGDGALAVSADLNAALDPNAGLIAGTLPTAADDPLLASGAALDVSRFGLGQGIVHHDNCPGHYILGAVLGQDGAPMPGVHITMIDEWGNRADAWSKNGPGDTGLYDFPIGASPNHYTLTVVDGNGTPISAPVTVEHQRGYGGEHACHTVVWQAY
jgi:hypothetical protein